MAHSTTLGKQNTSQTLRHRCQRLNVVHLKVMYVWNHSFNMATSAAQHGSLQTRSFPALERNKICPSFKSQQQYILLSFTTFALSLSLSLSHFFNCHFLSAPNDQSKRWNHLTLFNTALHVSPPLLSSPGHMNQKHFFLFFLVVAGGLEVAGVPGREGTGSGVSWWWGVVGWGAVTWGAVPWGEPSGGSPTFQVRDTWPSCRRKSCSTLGEKGERRETDEMD